MTIAALKPRYCGVMGYTALQSVLGKYGSYLKTAVKLLYKMEYDIFQEL